MVPEASNALFSRILSLASPLKGTACRSTFRVASRRKFNQFAESSNCIATIFRGTKPIRVRIPNIFFRQNVSYRPFHYSYKCANQISSGVKTDLGLAAKLKRLSREYGWSAFGVYLTLSALDFPFCYLLVRYLGADKIGEWEQAIVSFLKSFVPDEIQNTFAEWRAFISKKKDQSAQEREDLNVVDNTTNLGTSMNSVEEAEKNNKKHASIATQLALAYAIHKSFIFIRVPLTAAITPNIVKILRGWGWDIGKRTTKQAKILKKTELRVKSQRTAVKRKFLRFPRLARIGRFGKNRD